MVLISEIVQTFILADFCYYYVKRFVEGSFWSLLPRLSWILLHHRNHHHCWPFVITELYLQCARWTACSTSSLWGGVTEIQLHCDIRKFNLVWCCSSIASPSSTSKGLSFICCFALSEVAFGFSSAWPSKRLLWLFQVLVAFSWRWWSLWPQNGILIRIFDSTLESWWFVLHRSSNPLFVYYAIWQINTNNACQVLQWVICIEKSPGPGHHLVLGASNGGLLFSRPKRNFMNFNEQVEMHILYWCELGRYREDERLNRSCLKAQCSSGNDPVL